MAKKKKRVKSDKPITIPVADWKEADDMVRQVGNHQMEIESLQAEAQKKIDKIKDDLQKKVDSIQGKCETLVLSLEVFCKAHPNQFKKLRSKKLAFGKVGFYRSVSISIKKTTAGLIKKIYSRYRAKRFFRHTESVSKDALGQLTDEQLAKLGAQRKEKDVFYVEPNKIEAADHSG